MKKGQWVLKNGKVWQYYGYRKYYWTVEDLEERLEDEYNVTDEYNNDKDITYIYIRPKL